MELLTSVLNVRLLGVVLFLVAMVLLLGYLNEKNRREKKKRPGQLLQYTVPGQTAASVRGILGSPSPADDFSYVLEPAKNGGEYLHLTGHKPTGQVLDTLFLLRFEGDTPAQFSLRFVREAFGQREPIVPEALLDEFFKKKLSAHRSGSKS
ncbi:hypothetical protein LJC49_11215, partial [Ruminococcaceae bacterium OttesenSCG-928-I18]|nr:hypothetical protein [Ruminococcaceae bacterium OttesenSCG-928-I18]